VEESESSDELRSKGGIYRLGRFFFFRMRSNDTSGSSEYAPSGPSVFGAALDLSLPVFFNYHIFIVTVNQLSDTENASSAKLLPLIFFSVLMVRSMIPPARRLRFWSTIKITVMAPFRPVCFRDSFVGDILTSWIVPIQDFLFGLCYYVTVLYGHVSRKYTLEDSAEMILKSDLVYKTILPIFAMFPLWWKFLQCLRLCYDSNMRWPYLGDAFKYLSAGIVIVYGMTHEEAWRNPFWAVLFLATLLYQIWWDTFMDWELFEISPKSESDSESPFWSFSSFRPSSRFLLGLQQYLIQPVIDLFWRLRWKIPDLKQISLRSRRLYKTKDFYWRIFIFNAVFRFTWMICFIPAFSINGYAGVILAVIEISRRTLWGILKVEMETIHMIEHVFVEKERQAVMAEESQEQGEDFSDEDGEEQNDPLETQVLLPLWVGTQVKQRDSVCSATGKADSPKRLFECDEHQASHLLFAELGAWAISFVALSMWTAHL